MIRVLAGTHPIAFGFQAPSRSLVSMALAHLTSLGSMAFALLTRQRRVQAIPVALVTATAPGPPCFTRGNVYIGERATRRRIHGGAVTTDTRNNGLSKKRLHPWCRVTGFQCHMIPGSQGCRTGHPRNSRDSRHQTGPKVRRNGATNFGRVGKVRRPRETNFGRVGKVRYPGVTNFWWVWKVRYPGVTNFGWVGKVRYPGVTNCADPPEVRRTSRRDKLCIFTPYSRRVNDTTM